MRPWVGSGRPWELVLEGLKPMVLEEGIVPIFSTFLFCADL